MATTDTTGQATALGTAAVAASGLPRWGEPGYARMRMRDAECWLLLGTPYAARRAVLDALASMDHVALAGAK